MSEKQWIIKVSLFFALFCLLFLFIINIAVDPNAEYLLWTHPLNKNKYFATDKTTPIVLSQKLKTKPHALIFGTSRTNSVSEDNIGKEVLNFSSSLYCRPADVYYFLQHLSSKQKTNVSEIYLLIDPQCFYPYKSIYQNIVLEFDFSYILNTLKHISRDKCLRAISTVIRNVSDNNGYVNENGVVVHAKHPPYNPSLKELEEEKNGASYVYDEETIEYLRKINVFCTENKIPITFFTGIFNHYYLRQLNFQNFANFLTKVLDKIPCLYSFLYLEDVSNNLSHFYDFGHYKQEITDLQFQILRSEELSKAYKISKENISNYLHSLQNDHPRNDS